MLSLTYPASKAGQLPTCYMLHIVRVGQNHIFTVYMTVYLVISQSKILYIHCKYMVLANPNNM
jgi:hypothetical protein